jgi:hypothetical protein
MNITGTARQYRVPDSHALNKETEPSGEIREIKEILESQRNLSKNQ